MIEEQALVTRVNGSQVYIHSMQSSACKQCVQQDSCGTALYAKILPSREIALYSHLQLNVGDTVIVGIEENHLLRASLFMYLLPLLIMLLTVGFFEGSEEMTALLAFFSLITGLYLVHRFQQRFTQNLMSPPQIVRKV